METLAREYITRRRLEDAAIHQDFLVYEAAIEAGDRDMMLRCRSSLMRQHIPGRYLSEFEDRRI